VKVGGVLMIQTEWRISNSVIEIGTRAFNGLLEKERVGELPGNKQTASLTKMFGFVAC
jgi:hypothetical protein